MGPSSSAARKRTSTPKKPLSKPLPSKKPARPNASILNFFQKTEKPEPTLFLEGHDKLAVPQNGEGVEPEIYDAEPWEEEERFNEVEASIKKRRLSQEQEKVEEEPSAAKKPESPIQSEATPSSPTLEAKSAKKQSTKRKGPFLDDSDSEEDTGPAKKSGFLSKIRNRPPIVPSIKSENTAPPDKLEEGPTPLVPSEGEETTPPGKETSCSLPPLKVEDSIDVEFANVDEFGDLDDFPDDEDIGGEEYRMMQYMEEQARLEAEADNGDTGDYSCDDLADAVRPSDAMVVNCPICDGNLAGITSDEATRHVNACLDGNPIPILRPKENKRPKKEDFSRPPILELPEASKRFARAAVPRQGQANPFNLSEVENKPTSAFSKLMSGHAEDAAWAGAAAAEHSARGKPAYKRTCPFYKIMPGFYICVDAFRYGAVKGVARTS
ncbi:DNA repair metallo-beta-lactamase [Colletotrichum tofieldiae]|nr:DNA repair metallo-beta-lactamase [Colletotrichum tofieldiae]